ncbi:hypothetical protein BDD12DRAFT_880931 [Trichophaea hybrida]|nr:hypothetical protein BDD12DRAFT_880931 [Trichophaea hybrida]
MPMPMPVSVFFELPTMALSEALVLASRQSHISNALGLALSKSWRIGGRTPRTLRENPELFLFTLYAVEVDLDGSSWAHNLLKPYRQVEEKLMQSIFDNTRTITYEPVQHKFPTIQELGKAILHCFKKQSLQYAGNLKLEIGAIKRPPEACYQDEFYRALHEVLGFSTRVSSEWSGSNDGRIDFLLPDPGWGFELLRDGEGLSEHCERFVGNRPYAGWVFNGSIRQWLVLDFRTTQPNKYSGSSGANLWRVVFQPGFGSFRVLDSSNGIVVPETVMAN